LKGARVFLGPKIGEGKRGKKSRLPSIKEEAQADRASRYLEASEEAN